MSSLADLTEARSIKIPRALKQSWFVVAAFSLFYFVDVLLRAHDKFFWYDEVFTVWFCQVSGIGALWHALESGVDFNPPFFYWLTEAGQYVFGQGHIGARITEIFSFWIFCLCLFRFVSRRAGIMAGTIAMLLPVVTQAYYWAYEARPHGLVLGFCGLALIFWQTAVERPFARRRWLAGFSLALLGAMMMHCYALVLVAPFALVEIYRTWRSRRVDGAMWAALVIPPALSCCLYIPLLLSYRKLVQGNTLLDDSHAGWTRFEQFYWFLFQPCILVVLAALVFFAIDLYAKAEFRREQAGPGLSRAATQEAVKQDFLLGVGFILVPLFGIALGKLIQAPFFNRYYLAGVAGVCIVTGFGAGSRTAGRSVNWVAPALALVAVLTAGANFGRLIVAKLHGQGELLILPDSREEMETTPGRPLLHQPLLESLNPVHPVAVLDPYDFIYLVENAPAALKQRLYFASETTGDFAYGGFARFLEVTPVQFHKPVTVKQFVHDQPDGLLYGKTAKLERLALAEQEGCRLEQMQTGLGHYLASCRQDIQ